MQPTSATIRHHALVLWMPTIIGVMAIWKMGHRQFSTFRIMVRQTRDLEKANVQLEVAIQETQVRMVDAMPVVVSVNTEVISPPEYSPEATAQHQAQMEDVDRLIAAIEAVEEEYWGSTYM
ncbi:hypothetical protein GSI_04562 [Ganoderma sinense ZZ0214-1]|uniref:Uncharacterized protein n=1 Tax=Ganoderma sinense ZZ0214-1 TaxID=1077348 RepID=A0A2G8SH78_9APHY|nr:hypothetical protein GSI_04562 [Ganoderma sinense ZZ0214-1]